VEKKRCPNQRQVKSIFGGRETDTLGFGHNAGRTVFTKSTTGLIGGRGRGRGILSKVSKYFIFAWTSRF